MPFAFAAGTCAKLFMWWYYKPELMVVVAVMLAITLICLQRDILTAIIGTLTFLVLADIGFFSLVESPYFMEVLSKGSFIFSTHFSNHNELQHFSLPQILTSATGSMEIGLVGLTGLALFTFRHPILALVSWPACWFWPVEFSLWEIGQFSACGADTLVRRGVSVNHIGTVHRGQSFQERT